jgi:seryl-tRNA synthetase
MFDLKWIRDHPEEFDAGLHKRGHEPVSARIIELDRVRREHIAMLQDAQTRRNEASKLIGAAKASGEEDKAADLIGKVADLKALVQKGEEEGRRFDEALDLALSELPNLPLDDVPLGADESANVEYKIVGDIPQFDFSPKEHFEIGEQLGLMDFETAAKLSGSRFVVLRGDLARLDRALAAFMLDLHTGENGYCEIQPPYLVRDHVAYGTAQLPKFAEDLFRTENGMWLIPTAEVPLTNLVRETTLDESALPQRFTAYTPCFRSEAGAAGKDTRGMIRQHQFNKVEMVSITTPETSSDELERMLGCAEEVLKRLGLSYRVVVLSTGDMGFGARKTYDIEVWLPGQNAYREISSCSVCGDFQARRMQARYRPADGGAPRYVHTLNGSGLAIGRTMVALMENGQQADGSVVLPEALRPYMGGMESISPPA